MTFREYRRKVDHDVAGGGSLVKLALSIKVPGKRLKGSDMHVCSTPIKLANISQIRPLSLFPGPWLAQLSPPSPQNRH